MMLSARRRTAILPPELRHYSHREEIDVFVSVRLQSGGRGPLNVRLVPQVHDSWSVDWMVLSGRLLAPC